jgi:molecular chaperone GrpE
LETDSVTNKKENPFEEPVEFDIGADEETGNPEEIDSELAQAEAELARHREAMLRMQAEMDNLRKRLMRDLERSRKLALEKVMKDLLQVWDSLERGLEVDAGSLSVESLLEGQELTLRMLEKVLQDHDLGLIDPIGEAFDPELHQAMTVMPAADVDENTVLEVLQKGFRLHDRLIRPAMVVVSGKP